MTPTSSVSPATSGTTPGARIRPWRRQRRKTTGFARAAGLIIKLMGSEVSSVCCKSDQEVSKGEEQQFRPLSKTMILEEDKESSEG